MKRDELLAKGYSEEQVSELLDLWHKTNADLVKQNEALTSDLENANNKIAGLSEKEKELNSIKQAQLSDSEKLALKVKEIEEREKISKQNEMESRKVLNEAKARVILSEIGGISDSILKSIVTDDENTTIQNANDLLNQFKSFKQETINKTKEELSSVNIKPAPSNTNLDTDAMTWDKFNTLSSDEQSRFQEEHPEEFAKL